MSWLEVYVSAVQAMTGNLLEQSYKKKRYNFTELNLNMLI